MKKNEIELGREYKKGETYRIPIMYYGESLVVYIQKEPLGMYYFNPYMFFVSKKAFLNVYRPVKTYENALSEKQLDMLSGVLIKSIVQWCAIINDSKDDIKNILTNQNL